VRGLLLYRNKEKNSSFRPDLLCNLRTIRELGIMPKKEPSYDRYLDHNMPTLMFCPRQSSDPLPRSAVPFVGIEGGKSYRFKDAYRFLKVNNEFYYPGHANLPTALPTPTTSTNQFDIKSPDTYSIGSAGQSLENDVVISVRKKIYSAPNFDERGLCRFKISHYVKLKDCVGVIRTEVLFSTSLRLERP
jgi:hypothetical protein